MTRRSYTDLQPGLGAVDLDPETADPHLLAGAGGAGAGHGVAPRGEHEADARPAADGVGQSNRPATAGAQDEHVDTADALRPQRFDGAPDVGVAREDHNRGPAAAPQLGARCDLEALHGWRRAVGSRERGSGHESGDRSDGEGSGPGSQTQPHSSDDDQREPASSIDVRERQRGGQAGNPSDPRQQRPRRQMEELGGPPAQEAGGESPDQPPHHHRTGRRSGQQVRRKGCKWHLAEGRDQHGGHADLRRRRDGQRRGDPETLEEGAYDGDAGAGSDGEEEANRSGQHRVDQHQRGHGQGEEPDRARRSTGCRRHHGQRGHGHGPQHRGFPARQDPKGGQYAGAGHQPPPKAQTAEQRCRDGEYESHVLPAHGEKVGEARGAEVVDLDRVLVAVVTDDEPGEQGAARLAHRVGAGDEGAAQLVGEAAHRTSGPRIVGRGHNEAAADVAPAQVAAADRDRREPAFHPHPLAGQARPEQGTGIARSRGLHAATRVVEAKLEAHPARHPNRVGHHRRRSPKEPRGRRVLDAGPRPGAQHGCGHRRRQPDHGCAPREHGGGDDGHDQRRWDGQRPPGAGHGHDGQHDDLPVAHRTVTLGRIDASFASPMPRTSSSSSTERNRPFSLR